MEILRTSLFFSFLLFLSACGSQGSEDFTLFAPTGSVSSSSSSSSGTSSGGSAFTLGGSGSGSSASAADTSTVVVDSAGDAIPPVTAVVEPISSSGGGIGVSGGSSGVAASGLAVRNFIWKPVSERDGNLVVLVDEFGITVLVNGAPLIDFGPSNSRGTTARADRPGGAFGSNITVTFRDSDGRTVVLANGEPSVVIPNGSQRVEFVL